MSATTALYLRVSTKDQRLDSQELELRRLCQVRGWGEPVVYAEKASASKHRPELERLMNDVRAGRVARLVCYKLDRIGRSLSHLALLIDELSRLGVPLVCSSQGIDTSADNPVGRLQLGVLMAVAQFEREIIRERVNAGLAAAVARGVKLGPKEILSKRLPEVRALRAQGRSQRQIAALLSMPASSVHKVLHLELDKINLLSESHCVQPASADYNANANF